MNAMGHQVANFIGMRQRDLSGALRRAAPGAMAMGTTGMAEMAKMSMPLPPNTLPMMTGTGPFGPIEMGGMFTVVKVREDLAPGDYRDPGWYKHPQGTVAFAVDTGNAGAAAQQPKAGESRGMDMPGMGDPQHHH
jgi:hypothetical protein